MNRTISFVVILTTFVSSLLHAAEPDKAKLRTWKDATGKFSVQAVLVRVLGKQVVLRRTDNKEISVPIAKLSATDRQYLKDFKPSTPPNADDKTAVAALKKLGAEIEQDDQGRAVELNLRRTKGTDAGLAHLKGLPNLRELNLESTQVSDAGLVHLKGLTGLKTLRLGGTKVTDAGLVQLKGLANLTDLKLSRTQVTDAGLVHLKGLKNLQTLSLPRRITDAGLVHLKGMANLETLHLPRRITDAGLAHLKGLTGLRSLTLGFFLGSQISDKGMVHLQRLTNLQILDLKFTNVTDAGLAHFKGMNLKKLTIPTEARTDQGLQHYLAAVEPPIELDFGGNVGVPEWKLTDAGLVHLKGLTSLQNITLPKQITDAGLVHLKGLTNLQELSLGGTKQPSDE